MTTTPREGMFDAFLSYSRKDVAFADRLRAELSNAGKTVWIDREDILPAEAWNSAAFQGIDSSHNFLFLISPDSVAPKQDGSPSPCGQELAHAIQSGKRLIPLHYRETPHSAVAPELRVLNDVDFRAAAQSDQALAEAVRILLSAMDTDIVWLRQKTVLQLRAQEWESQNRDASRLLRGDELRKFEQWQANPSGQISPPTPLQTEFLLASGQYEHRRQRRNQRITASVAVALLVFAAYAFVKRAEAIHQLRIATAGRLAAEALNLRDTNLDLAFLLSREAVEIDPTYDARNAELTLDQTAPSLFTYINFPGGRVDLSSTVFSPDAHRFAVIEDSNVGIWDITSNQRLWLSRKYPSPVHRLAWSAQGGLLAANFDDGTTRVWNVRTDKPSLLWSAKERSPGANSYASPLAFNQHGTLLAVLVGGKITIWSAECCHQLMSVISPHGIIGAFAFLPGNSSRLAVLTQQGDLQIFAASNGAMLSSTTGLFSNSTTESSIAAVPLLDFSRDGSLMAVEYFDGQVGLFRILPRQNGETFKMVHNFSLNEPYIPDFFTAMSFSPDGKTLATISYTGVLRQWSTTTFQPVTGMPNRVTGLLYTLSYNSEGKLLVAGESNNGNMVEWSEAGLPYRVLGTGQTENPIIALTWSADSRYLAGGDKGGAVYIWKSTQPRPLKVWADNTENPITSDDPSIAFSTDQKSLWLGGEGGIDEIRDWENHAAKPVALQLQGFSPIYSWAVVSSRAAVFTSHGSQGGIHVIYANGKTSYLKGPTPANPILNTTGSVLAVMDNYGWSIWQLTATGKAAPPFQRRTLVHSSMVLGGALNASGARFAGLENQIYRMTVWNTSTGKPTGRSYQAPSGNEVVSAALPPNAQPYMAVTLQYGGPQVLDRTTMSLIGLPLPEQRSNAQATGDSAFNLNLFLVAHSQSAEEPAPDYPDMIYSPNGKWLAYGDGHGNVWLWDANPKDWAARDCRVAGRNMTKAEWDHYVGRAIKYQKTCPQYPSGAGEK